MKFSFLLFIFILAGCGIAPLHPGVSQVTDKGAYVRQSQNPQEGSKQVFEKTTEVLLPPTITNSPSVISRTTERVETQIGAAQKDTTREIGAKLAALSGVVWVGVGLFIFGAASAFYPPLKLVVGSVTTSAILAAAGLALIILPSLLVGHELLILSIAVGAAGLYWFAHRHGSLRGAFEALVADVKSIGPKS